jgi:hypothetical protein
MNVTDRIIAIENYFKANPSSKVYQKMVYPRLSEIDEDLEGGCSLDEFLDDCDTDQFVIVTGNSVPFYEHKRFDPFFYYTKHAAEKDLIDDEERVVSMLEYIEMCIEYEKNHK